MGIFHHRVIGTQKECIDLNCFPPSLSVIKEIDLDHNGKIGLLCDPNILSYLSLSQKSQQNKISIALDGHIYNKKELCCKLNINQDVDIAKVAIEIYQQYGWEGLYDLDGAFSLVLYDSNERMTLLYRSFLTGYPLYCVAKNNVLSVSTNPVHLLHRPDVSDTLDAVQMSASFSLNYAAWTDTIFSDISEVPHGEMRVITADSIESKKRPLSDVFTSVKYGSEAEVIDTYTHLLESTVEKNILPGNQYGIMLSSGMDSASLAALASKYLKHEGKALRAYSWALPDSRTSDESQKIRELCHALGIELTLFNGEKFGPFDALDTLIMQPDTPFSNPYWTVIEQIYRKASEDGVNVLLNGNYGDILFPETSNLFVDAISDKRFDLLLPMFKSIVKQVGFRNTLRRSPAVHGLLHHMLPFRKQKKSAFNAPKWLSPDAKENIREIWENKKSNIEQEYRHFSTALSKNQASYSGMDRYLGGKYGIERLEPYMNLELLNYTKNIPSYMTYRDGLKKHFAREAMRGLLPESIRTQPRVGILNQFAFNSFERNKDKVKAMLFNDLSWKAYVDEEWMQKKLQDNVDLSYGDLLIIWRSLNIGPWQKAIKPGGSLYEGKFNSIKKDTII